MICPNGTLSGQPCLDKWIKDNLLGNTVVKNVTVQLNGVNTTFGIYENGAVDFSKNGTILCNVGGQTCIDNWVKEHTIKCHTETVIVGDKRYVYTVCDNGTVTLDGKVICVQNVNNECLQADIDKKTSEADFVERKVIVDGVTHTFRLFKDGHSKYMNRDELICAAGQMKGCMDQWIFNNLLNGRPTSTPVLPVNGKNETFFFWPNTTVVAKNNLDIICYSEGRPCLDEWIKDNTKPHTTLYYDVDG